MEHELKDVVGAGGGQIEQKMASNPPTLCLTRTLHAGNMHLHS